MKHKRTILLTFFLSFLTLLTCTGMAYALSDDADLEQLLSLPYLQWNEKESNSKEIGVVKYDKERSYFGYNLFTDDNDRIQLMDMNGEIVFTWKIEGYARCEWGYIYKNGDALAVCVNQGLVKVDKNSDIVWEYKSNANHDVEVLEDGRIVVPTAQTYNYLGRKVEFHALDFLDSQGNFLERWSTFSSHKEILKYHKANPLDVMAEKSEARAYDYYHLNSVQAIPETPSGLRDRRFQKGNLLICLRNVNLILILDKDTKNIVWSWGVGFLDFPHMPHMLPNGNILIYDNGANRSFTRIIELNPLTETIVWQYKTDPPSNFYSKWRGSNQRLPNGNTLICESEKGHVFEITKKGEIVWEYWNPVLNKKGHRGRIYRFTRRNPEFINNILEK